MFLVSGESEWEEQIFVDFDTMRIVFIILLLHTHRHPSVEWNTHTTSNSNSLKIHAEYKASVFVHCIIWVVCSLSFYLSLFVPFVRCSRDGKWYSYTRALSSSSRSTKSQTTDMHQWHYTHKYQIHTVDELMLRQATYTYCNWENEIQWKASQPL